MTMTELPGRVDLSEHGIEPSGRVYRNPTTSLLYSHALLREAPTKQSDFIAGADWGHTLLKADTTGRSHGTVS